MTAWFSLKFAFIRKANCPGMSRTSRGSLLFPMNVRLPTAALQDRLRLVHDQRLVRRSLQKPDWVRAWKRTGNKNGNIGQNTQKIINKGKIIVKHMGSANPAADIHDRYAQPIDYELERNEQTLNELLNDCSDAVLHKFKLGMGRKAILVYISGQSDMTLIDQQVIRPLVDARGGSGSRKIERGDERKSSSEAAWTGASENGTESGEEGDPERGGRMRLAESMPVAPTKTVFRIGDLLEEVFQGNPVLLMEGETMGISFGLADWEKRAIEEPMAESVIRGPREGFTETLITNMAMLRRRLRTPLFKMRPITLGRLSRTRVVIAFIESIAPKELVEEAMNRLRRVDVDGVMESGALEEYIQDNPWSPFPQLLATERPDVATAALMEGKIVLLVEGTPFSLIAPTTLFAFLQSPEDYYQKFFIGTTVRWLRFLFFIMALLFPSMYVAVLTFHQEMVPTTLLLSIAKSREDIPFPALFEAIMMEVTFEALREAGVRLPKQVGAAVSIVGALVIGEAATAAGLVSPIMVMVVALTGIASFMIPHYPIGISLRLLRFPIMLLAGIVGMLGVILGVILLVIHLCQLRSFGMPYLSGMMPARRNDWKDTWFRAPLWTMDKRPEPAVNDVRLHSPAGEPKRQGEDRN
jgi:spore germination protein KA